MAHYTTWHVGEAMSSSSSPQPCKALSLYFHPRGKAARRQPDSSRGRRAIERCLVVKLWRAGGGRFSFAPKYKPIWMVEEAFRSMKSLLDTRPNFHKRDETIRGHVFCSFLALSLRKKIEDRLARKGRKLGWADVIRNLDSVVEMEVAVNGEGYVFRGQNIGVAGKVFQACGVALSPALRPSA